VGREERGEACLRQAGESKKLAVMLTCCIVKLSLIKACPELDSGGVPFRKAKRGEITIGL